MTSTPAPPAEPGSDYVPSCWSQFRTFMSQSPELLVSGVLGSGKCVDEDTPIQMATGALRPIREIVAGDGLVSLSTSNHELVTSRVLGIIDTGIKDGYRVRLRGGDEVIVSEDHPFYSITGFRRRGKWRRPGGQWKEPLDFGWIPTKSLARGQYVALANSVPRQIKESRFTVDQHELMGYLIGDGGFTGGKGRSVQFTNSEPSVIDRVRELAGPSVEMRHNSKIEWGFKRPGWGSGDLRRGMGWRRNEVSELVESWGLSGKGSATKRIPSFVFSHSEQAIAALVSGLIVTDGWVDQQRLGYASVSRELVRDLRHCLRIIGVYATFRLKRGTYQGLPHRSWTLTVDRVEDLERLAGLLRLGHKAAKLNELIAKKRFQRGPLKGQNKHWRVGQVTFKQIESITPVGPRRMYDIAVEGTHNFVGDGFILHNTKSLCEKADTRARTYKGSRVAICRLYREHIGASVLPEYRKVVTAKHWNNWWRRAEDGGSTLFYPASGSLVMFLGLDNPQRLQSTEFDLILVEQAEEIDEERWDYASGRLRNKAYRIEDDGTVTDELAYTQIAGFCNPESPEHFLFKRFRPDQGSHIQWSMEPVELKNGMTVPPGQVVSEVVCAKPTDNREHLDPKYLERLERKRGRYYERMVLGKWVAFEGQVFDNWQGELGTPPHVIRRPKSWDEWGGYPPPSWERFRSIDFGYHPDPFVCIWAAKAPGEGPMIVYREIYKTRRTVSENGRVIVREEEKELAAMREFSERNGYTPPKYINLVMSVSDHAHGDRATLEAEGVVVDKANKDRSAGIQSLYETLDPEKRPDGSKRHKILFVHPDTPGYLVDGRDEDLADRHMPTCGIEEFGQLRWDEKKRGKEIAATIGADHFIDGLRYMVFTREMALWGYRAA